jgi:hypothetical protein
MTQEHFQRGFAPPIHQQSCTAFRHSSKYPV